mmetsp:Transcript_1684/g.2217  ORF Transcript_1684/g.2217 Transcript_1684/m.2217 type:complete len:157 (-) Transcript_1684:42-512(-)|eukprot:CAMPEP_0197291198 /NCGR_PEP_ID=MMETSP0890-20130614/11744_1 /TAXON_ID=44058 ORGANISM="Aureoumbra lagunensis, Strain CCMP1510" /NCGR_SAMPLE_ID=MMETSP0890 /ASSEMBLY_ACC=CAM_ASM_000533 /LENGTH=156 /DNA_ID=CAMNT_0042763835 /DNA_START=56 /DNA_END=526 /DNA_ORIENTATION=-
MLGMRLMSARMIPGLPSTSMRYVGPSSFGMKNTYQQATQIRTVLGFSVDVDENNPEMAMTYLNRKMRGVIKKLKERRKGALPPNRIRYFAKKKAAQRHSFKKIQIVLAQIEIERTLLAERRKADRMRKKMEAADPSLARNEYLEAILAGRDPPDLH